jgi:hypothetical protein
MELDAVLENLEYSRSPNFLVGAALESDPDYGHIFRKARRDCSLAGAYVLRGADFGERRGMLPVVYVATAATEVQARRIHRLVWNQNIVPFLIVVSPAAVRLYPGFRYVHSGDEGPDAGAIRTLRSFNELSEGLDGLRAASIDNGEIWKRWNSAVTPETRVDWRLLDNLRDLDQWLRASGVADRLLAHAVIGKFVYLHYLRERGILSDRKLEEWNIQPTEIFGRRLRLSSFERLLDHLDDWLNGSVFPLSKSKIGEFGAARLRQVAAVFQGDSIAGQLHLDFPAYDFSFIPIETLSVIYQQFLHSTESEAGESAGDARGAYYTPVPVVNFMLDRLDAFAPLRPGMRVLDPSCGSGAFLVQCYRRLIEDSIRREPSNPPKPTELRRLLVESIFGFDVDEDACRIAEMSLVLTLLEYVHPPDLTKTNFKLPQLSDRNIFRANAFSTDHGIREIERSFDWIVGNPPWMALDPKNLNEVDRPVFDWMKTNSQERPTGGYQVAEAFTWRACDFAESERALIHLLIPAMTLVRSESRAFRRELFSRTCIRFVANFANFSEILFAGRSRVPAASVLFSPGAQNREPSTSSEWIEVYSPFVANHPTSAPNRPGERKEVWSLVLNASELRSIRAGDIRSGDALPWKIAMWGSPVDARLLQRVRRRFTTIGQLEDEKVLVIAQGVELRRATSSEPVESHPELVGRPLLNVRKLRKREYLLRFPKYSIESVPPERSSVRQGRYRNAIRVCEPPHVVLGEARTFAVFSNEFLIVPHPQIGIWSEDQGFLKALALYLNSDFSYYYEFLVTAQAGIQKSITTLQSLRSLPVPFSAAGPAWEQMYAEIEQAVGDRDEFGLDLVLERLNALTAQSLGLNERERAAVHDLVRVKMTLLHGKVSPAASTPPGERQLFTYGETLRAELDGFLGDGEGGRHEIRILTGGEAGIVEIKLNEGAKTPFAVGVAPSDAKVDRELTAARASLVEKRAQWVYFDRNLKIYERDRTYLLKPLQNLHWTPTQALIDAGDLIAEILASENAAPAGVQ